MSWSVVATFDDTNGISTRHTNDTTGLVSESRSAARGAEVGRRPSRHQRAVTLEAQLLRHVDRLVRESRYPNRSRGLASPEELAQVLEGLNEILGA